MKRTSSLFYAFACRILLPATLLMVWLALWILAPVPHASAQTATNYDCSFSATFTGSGALTAITNTPGSHPCTSWRVTYWTTSSLVARLQFETSPDNSSWTAVPNTICSSSVQPPCVIDGANPFPSGATTASQGTFSVNAYGAFVRVNVTATGGSGTGTVQIYGYKGLSAKVNINGGAAGPTGPTGPAGGSSNAFAQTASVTVANTAAETTLLGAGEGSLTIAANTLAVGSTYRLKGWGYHSATASPTLTIRLNFNGAAVASTGTNSSGTATDQLVEIDFWFTVRSTGVTGTCFIEGTYIERSPTGNTSFNATNTATTSINTTADIGIDVTAQWGTASNSNSITMVIFTLDLVRA